MTSTPDHYQPYAEQPAVQWKFWKREFIIFLTRKESQLQDQVDSRRAGMAAAPTADQEAALTCMAYSDKKQLLDFFTCLGSEGLRQFLIKTNWDPSHLDGRTMAEAWTAADELFGTAKHPILARRELYTAPKKPRETFEQYVVRLRQIAVDCLLGDTEDERIMESFMINCGNDELLLRKILDAYPRIRRAQDIPTLAQVLAIAIQHEATDEDSP